MSIGTTPNPFIATWTIRLERPVEEAQLLNLDRFVWNRLSDIASAKPTATVANNPFLMGWIGVTTTAAS